MPPAKEEFESSGEVGRLPEQLFETRGHHRSEKEEFKEDKSEGEEEEDMEEEEDTEEDTDDDTEEDSDEDEEVVDKPGDGQELVKRWPAAAADDVDNEPVRIKE